MIPVVFSALAMQSAGKAAMDMVNEVRRQFREIPGILEGTGKPEYSKGVDISTKAALREMMLPGAMTIITPIIVGFVMGAEALGAYMAGVTVSGVLWAIFQNNAGGAWDNAKKSFEAGVEINGEMTYKGSDAHKAAVTGDTVGDPFKDTSGPSMNILIKLTCLVGLVIAPILGGHTSEKEVALESPAIATEAAYVEAVDADGNFIYNTGETIKLKLPSGKILNIGNSSSEFKIHSIFSNPDYFAQLSKNQDTTWITLDRVHFQTNSSKILGASEEQLRNIAEL